MKVFLFLFLALGLASCNHQLSDFDHVRDLDSSSSDTVRGMAVHDNGNLMVFRQPINSEELIVDEYEGITGDLLTNNSVATLSAAMSGDLIMKASAVAATGQGVDFIGGLYYLSTGSGQVIIFDDTLSNASILNLTISSTSNSLVCGGDGVSYACVDDEGAISIFMLPLSDQQLPALIYVTDPTERLNGLGVRDVEAVRGVEVQSHYVFVYRGSMTSNTNQSFWIDVYDMNTGLLIEQKQFNTSSVLGLPNDVEQTVEPNGLTIRGTTIYFGVYFESVDQLQVKHVLLGDTDFIPGLENDDAASSLLLGTTTGKTEEDCVIDGGTVRAIPGGNICGMPLSVDQVCPLGWESHENWRETAQTVLYMRPWFTEVISINGIIIPTECKRSDYIEEVCRIDRRDWGNFPVPTKTCSLIQQPDVDGYRDAEQLCEQTADRWETIENLSRTRGCR